ncbi:putative metal-nicotianamine transporter YSL7 [Heracleum sosnowskyi]|uniref:Metal-nicotianamine transporter YSL7 n=1 Tax=Heracleum sosnowskyi TaxID=360622 RepID=A0AAD8IRE4_9APIA|nr:putative metal-nicotianamine transporter YSL7 [Heracleum sosnowskyi]
MAAIRGFRDPEEQVLNQRKVMVQQKNGLEDDDGENKEILTTEMIFMDHAVPTWRSQLTLRAFVVSFVLGILLSVIVMKLNLTTGIIPSLNVSAGLLGFFFIKIYTTVLEKSGFLKQPFTRQENTVIQTCVVATAGIAFSGGFGSYLLAMTEVISKQSTEANDPRNTKSLSLGWMIGFLFTVSFLGLFSVLPLRKIMIIDYNLTYPSGTATANLINSFHTPQGAKQAKKQVKELGKFLSFSFLWSFFQWFFTAGSDCGFASFPFFGLKAYENRFYFDFSATYVGVGMICPYIINVSLLVGAILSWGIMWPLIENQEGNWYKSGLSPSSLHGIQGYRVFIAIAVILGDGLYNFIKVLAKTLPKLAKDGYSYFKKILAEKHPNFAKWLRIKDSASILPLADKDSPEVEVASFDDQRRSELFLTDQISIWLAIVAYFIIAAIAAATLPRIFSPLKFYHVLFIYACAPVLAFCNAYGCGLTDWSLASTYGKLAIFVIGAWAGKDHGGVLAGLAACGVMMNVVSTASDLTQDFKTGYLTLASPRSMFVSQVIGTAMGCVISPCVFWLFYKAFADIGIPDSEYSAPFAIVYRNIAILGVEGFDSLPKNCLTICYILFAGAIIVNAVGDLTPKRWGKYIPRPMAMAIPFYLGPYFAIDMCLGSLILFIWEKIDKVQADLFGPAVASGLICGDGIWSLPSSILALAGVKPPICMKFLSRGTNVKVDNFLNPS